MSHILLQNDFDVNEAVLKKILHRAIKSKTALIADEDGTHGYEQSSSYEPKKRKRMERTL